PPGSEPSRPTAARGTRLPYLPGLDGLRAISVVAVLLYHYRDDRSLLRGGFLGVEVFFVISGYLITALLLAERRRTTSVSLRNFWLRRARRLLPAVGVLIAVAMVVSAIADPGKIDQTRGDALASLFYFANWHFIFAHTSYFEQFGRPSLFTHLWSLSVEEQFYLFWPLVFAAGMKLFGRGRLLLGVLAGAAASVVLAWILFNPGHDASRVYYGTDTHAIGLLAGVALALVWSPTVLRLPSHRSGPLVGPILDALGVIALGYLILSFVHVHDYDLALWHGGYAWIALASVLLLAALAHPAARLGGILGRPALLWLGLRSYSFYLWHWPVLVMTRPGIDIDLPRGILIPLQLILCLILADLSYRFVELPFSGKAKVPKMPDGWLRIARPALLVSVLGVILIVGWSGIVKTGGSNPASAAASTATVAKVHAKLPPQETAREKGSPQRSGHGRQSKQDQRPRATKHWPRIIMLGDSVMIGAEEKLAARLGPGFSMDAEVGRQAEQFLEIIEKIKREGHHPTAMVIQWGNNGPLYSEDMEALRKATTNVGQLFLISDHAPVSWQDESNHAIREASEDWHHTTEIPWARVAEEEGESLFWDGIHLTPKGAGVYARLVSKVLHEKIPFPRKGR
ncbi:MAG TPA: acyltransferase family protein, partial [Solirubrobacterales bacterium]|nr:acyltransferase family protein [Solirubrobacterales bacterium]